MVPSYLKSTIKEVSQDLTSVVPAHLYVPTILKVCDIIFLPEKLSHRHLLQLHTIYTHHYSLILHSHRHIH